MKKNVSKRSLIYIEIETTGLGYFSICSNLLTYFIDNNFSTNTNPATLDLYRSRILFSSSFIGKKLEQSLRNLLMNYPENDSDLELFRQLHDKFLKMGVKDLVLEFLWLRDQK